MNMSCPQCEHASPADSSFCERCGTALPTDAPPTSSPVPTTARDGVRAPRPGSRSKLLVVVCVALAAAGAGIVLLATQSATGPPASLGPKVRVSISALRGASLPRDAQCSTFVPVPGLATVAASARCGSLDVVIDNEGGRANGCTHARIPHEPPYWDCRAETVHIKIQSFDFHKALAEKRLREAIELVLRVSRAG